jgi:tRNA C32,U32 (ribose-2'-O)-methylase TrmJ
VKNFEACTSESDKNDFQGDTSHQLLRSGVKIALVFGREELGMSDEEVDTCDVACSIPIGRLQESLSLSHAVSIVLSGIYAQRLEFISRGGDDEALGYKVNSPTDLAKGYDTNVGTEV